MGELTEREDEWGRRATAAAIAAARRIVLGDQAVVNMNSPVGRLNANPHDEAQTIKIAI